MKKIKIAIGKLNFWVNKEGYESYWDLVNKGKWEPETFLAFDKYINNETLFIDIGGWIGPTSLYGAQLAKKTVSLEPDPIAFKRLKQNVGLNSDTLPKKKLILLNLALWINETKITFTSDIRLGDSSSSILREIKDSNQNNFANKSFSADTISLESLLKTINLKDYNNIFVKVDIEGAEYKLFKFVLGKLSEIRANVLISLHPWLLQKGSKKGFIRRLKQALEHWRFCQNLKKNNFKLLSSKNNLPYISEINSIGWILIGKMHQDILAVPKNKIEKYDNY